MSWSFGLLIFGAVELLLDDGSFARKMRGLNIVRAPSAIANILVIRNPSVRYEARRPFWGGRLAVAAIYVGLVR